MSHTELISAEAPPPSPDVRPSQVEGIDEATWMEVIQKMDEVYSQLVNDEIVLEEKNEQLESSQQFIVSVLSAMSDVLVACNRIGDIEETNTALRELTGLDQSALHGMSIYKLLADSASIDCIRQVIEQTTPQRMSKVVEINLIHPLHGPMQVDVNCTQRLDGAGKHAGYVFVGRPMGEIKRAYQELSETHEELKRTQQQLLHSEKMASLGRLVAGVAHELNNPISFVLGNVHALKRYSERLALYVATLHESAPNAVAAPMREKLRIDHILNDLPSLIEGTLEGAQRTTDIVNGLKRFSAVDRDEQSKLDLNGVIERAIHWIGKGAAPTFTVHWTPGAELFVMGNTGKLLQVVMNLIQNACDAASDTRTAAPQLWITAQTNDQLVSIFLHDNGSGIFPDHLSRIFDPFFTTKPVGKGTGLGLSISYGIIEQHAGKLYARNHPEGGAEFVIELPLVTAN
ncbi:histidine kinase dimerization/phospho-acceptor domain-containing protein [Herbaspirillum sp. RTI4]|uniref:ATP-binding protein n=1 Tax=Herbaspirillum sp. RTI4 TaxID=3048640 RepID=UPI002AB53229|nr:ATP-binding protein [Herbaspirillum sp. RTI4]MDY7577053.1 histidine kinase dimerization/phospho-acceptor domain-containing protein [Herbaspirillum sp. RTI4]MEA9982233.1 histidine kinase dimerization/phospho-acceptor domain-containing protein [Herbaspirillum sp. RTI4]